MHAHLAAAPGPGPHQTTPGRARAVAGGGRGRRPLRGPAGSDCGSLDSGGIACGSITQVATTSAGTTYQLGLTLSGSAKNVYTVYGDTDTAMSLPAAYQADAPFGANVGGVAAAHPEAEQLLLRGVGGREDARVAVRAEHLPRHHHQAL